MDIRNIYGCFKQLFNVLKYWFSVSFAVLFLRFGNLICIAILPSGPHIKAWGVEKAPQAFIFASARLVDLS